jgi:cytochrome b
MNTASASRADAPATSPAGQPVLVWDLPVRVFHWLMVLCFAGAWLTAESERWQLLHVTLGYTMGGLVAFRVLWGLIGTRHARFNSFVRGPRRVLAYLRSLVRGEPEHHVGHNPAGALAIVAMLGLVAGIVLTGHANFNDIGGHWVEEVHEAAASVMLALVGVHLAGVLASSWLHGENLARAMVTGRKLGTPKDGVRSAWRPVGVLMLLAVLGFWWLQWQSAPPVARDGHGIAALTQKVTGHDDDD